MSDIKIDGISVNAKHFGAMPKKEAVAKMIADGFVPGETEKDKSDWASKAYDLINGNNRSSDKEPGKPGGKGDSK